MSPDGAIFTLNAVTGQAMDAIEWKRSIHNIFRDESHGKLQSL